MLTMAIDTRWGDGTIWDVRGKVHYRRDVACLGSLARNEVILEVMRKISNVCRYCVML